MSKASDQQFARIIAEAAKYLTTTDLLNAFKQAMRLKIQELHLAEDVGMSSEYVSALQNMDVKDLYLMALNTMEEVLQTSEHDFKTILLENIIVAKQVREPGLRCLCCPCALPASKIRYLTNRLAHVSGDRGIKR